MSNISRPFHIARMWAKRVTEEFIHQGDIEREKGFQVSPHMDRNTLNLAKSQRDFADFIALPLFKLLNEAVYGTAHLYQSIQQHREKWDELYQADLRAEVEEAPESPQHSTQLDSSGHSKQQSTTTTDQERKPPLDISIPFSGITIIVSVLVALVAVLVLWMWKLQK